MTKIPDDIRAKIREAATDICESCGAFTAEGYFAEGAEFGYLLSVDKDKESAGQGMRERFEMPTDKQVVDMAIIFNEGVIDHAKLSDMVGMCQFVIDRLYENGNIATPSSKEEK